jgi:hypothetical protein
MSWLRKLDFRHRYRVAMQSMDDFKRQKYLSFFRMAYFFSTTSLVLMLFHLKNEHDKLEEKKLEQKKLEAGQPVIRDESEAHAMLREKGVEAGMLYKYSPEKGWHLEEYHRGEYLSKLQKKALKDAQDAQRKAIREGRELPPDAILLIDESGSS